MSVLRLSVGGVSFQHRSCVAGHGPEIGVVTPSDQNTK
jgi:cytochrome c551/c552